MQIAFVNATSRWGGVKTWMLDFGAGLAARGHAVRVYGRQPEFIAGAKARVGHGEIVHFGADANPAAVWRFVQIFRRERTQLVLLNVGKDLATAGIAARLLRIPVIQRIGLPGDIPLRLKTRLLHQWIRPTFLAPCCYIADGFATSLPYLSGFDIKVILNGKIATTHPLLPHHPRQLIATQQLFPDKCHATLLRALAGIHTPYTLHIVGTGHEQTALRELAASLGIAGNIVWHGFSTDVPARLAEADIFLLASLSEGLPNTLLEALAAGLLPISRDVGGVCEVFPAALRHYLLPPEADETHFHNALAEALALSDEQLTALRTEARTVCNDDLSLDRRVNELEDLCEELCAQNGQQR